jgi:hypothetical protein
MADKTVDLTKVQAESTIGTFLYFGTTESALAKLLRIKDYPDLGGAPETIDTTDLECEDETSEPGVRSASAMEFTANFNMAVFNSVNEKSNTEGYYEIRFGDEDGTNGIFKWTGKHSIYPVGGSVNAAREMKVTITRSSKITPVTKTA